MATLASIGKFILSMFILKNTGMKFLIKICKEPHDVATLASIGKFILSMYILKKYSDVFLNKNM